MVVVGAVVVGGVVVVVGAVVDVGVVVEVAGAVVDVPGAVVVVVEAPEAAVIKLVMVDAGGLGTLASADTKAMVIICPLAKWTWVGFPLTSVPVFDSKLGHVFTVTNPCLPACGVPLGHVSPLLRSDFPGYCRVVELRTSPLYSETNLPSTALPPDSELFLGATVITPVPSVVKPVVELGSAGRLGCNRPQMSIPEATCHVSDVVGAPADDELGWVRW